MYLQQFIYTNPLFLYKIMIFVSTGCKNLECRPSLCAINNNYLISLHPGLPKLPAATKNQLFCTAWYSAYLKPDSLEKGGKISHLLQQQDCPVQKKNFVTNLFNYQLIIPKILPAVLDNWWIGLNPLICLGCNIRPDKVNLHDAVTNGN